MLTFSEKIPLMVDILGTRLDVNSTLNEKGLLNFQLKINNTQYLFSLTPQQVKQGVTLTVSNHNIPVSISLSEHTDEDTDDLQNYVMQFLQWFL